MEDKRNYFTVMGYTIPKRNIGIGLIAAALIMLVLFAVGVIH
jgi:hypothetical protein